MTERLWHLTLRLYAGGEFEIRLPTTAVQFIIKSLLIIQLLHFIRLAGTIYENCT